MLPGIAGGMMVAAGGGRIFNVSPAVSGKTTWNLDIDGPMTISTAGSWTITPHSGLSANVKLWGGGGGGDGGNAPSTDVAGTAGGNTTFAGMTAGGGANGAKIG